MNVSPTLGHSTLVGKKDNVVKEYSGKKWKFIVVA